MAVESASLPSRIASRELWPFGSARVLVFSAFAIPAAVFYMRFTESYALGTAMMIMLVLGYQSVLGVGHTVAQPIRLWNASRVSVLVTLAVLLHLIMTATVMSVDLGRALAGLILLFLMLLASAAMAEILLNLPDNRVDADIKSLAIVMFVVALIGLVGLGPPPLIGEAWRRPFFPFAEPAGFALPFCPIFIYACVRANARRRLALLVLGVAGLALLHTLTLVVAIGLAALVSLRKRQLIVFGAIAVVILAQLDLTYYTDRLDFAEDSSNLSSLVYVQGWQMLLEGLENSDFLGLGFQQLGVLGTEVSAAQAIRAMRDGEDLNILDGGFVVAKLGAEFGVFGLFAVLVFLVRACKSIMALRGVVRRGRRMASVDVLAHAVIVTFLIHLFIRSGGYFTGEVLVTLVALWIACGSKLRAQRNETAAVGGQQAGA